MHRQVWVKSIANKWRVRRLESQKVKPPNVLQHESAGEVSQERDRSYYGICFFLLL